MELANHLVQQQHIPCALVGTGGATPNGMKILKSYINSCPENYPGYRDSNTHTLVAASVFPLLIETYKDINTSSLLADKPVKDIVLSQLKEYYDLYFMSNLYFFTGNRTPGTRIQDLFKLMKFTREVQQQRSELNNSWLKFLQELESYSVSPLQKIRDFTELGVNLNIKSPNTNQF